VKGVWTLLKAFVHIIEDHPQVRLVMAGAPHVSISGNVVQHFLADHKIADKVEFVGHVQKEKIGEYYERCSLYAAPSYYETFCISAVEAMLHGKPVVASSETSLEEILEDGKTGLLVPLGDDKALAEAILRLLNDEGLAKRMGEAGREKAAQYQPDFIAEKTLEFYENVVNKEK
jgi:glycosyltransferase involved in cell wall biosynthesis